MADRIRSTFPFSPNQHQSQRALLHSPPLKLEDSSKSAPAKASDPTPVPQMNLITYYPLILLILGSREFETKAISYRKQKPKKSLNL